MTTYSGRQIVVGGFAALAIQSAAFALERLYYDQWTWEAWSVLSLAALFVAIIVNRGPPVEGMTAELMLSERQHRREAWRGFFSDHGDGIGFFFGGVFLIGLIVASGLTLKSCGVGPTNLQSSHAAGRVAEAFELLSDRNASCLVDHGERVISCLIVAEDHEAERLARDLIGFARQDAGRALGGWTLTLATQTDYKVTLPF